MTIYTWGPQAAIEQLETLPFGKRQEAVLHAREGTDPARLTAIREMFQSLGVAAIPSEEDGKQVLRLRGFESPAFLTRALEQNGFAEEKDRSTKPSAKKKEEGSFAEKVRGRSFKLSGWVYMIGDAALIISGWKRGDKNEAISGLAYGATSVVAAGWGHRKPEKVFDDLYAKMLGEFARDGVELPKGMELTAKELGKPGGLLPRMEKFLYDHPTQILTAGNAIAGFNLFRAGMNQGNNDKRIAGALVMTGMLIGLLVPEKAKKPEVKTIGEMAANLQDGADAGQVWQQPEPDKPKGVLGMLSGVRDWAQEKPLRIGGYMAMGNNAFMVKGALTERASHPKQREYLEQLKKGDAQAAATHLPDLQKRLTKAEYKELTKLDASDLRSKQQAAMRGFNQASSAEDKRKLNNTLYELDKEEAQLNDTIDARLEKLDKSEGMWKMNMVAAASYLVANGLLSISSTKGGGHSGGKDKNGNEKKDPNDELYAAAAAIIANQSEEVQDASIIKMATFLASQREIDIPASELIEKMREKVATVKDSPWLDPAKHGDRAAPAHQGEKEPLRIPDHVPDEWVQKEALRNAAAKDSGLTGASR